MILLTMLLLTLAGCSGAVDNAAVEGVIALFEEAKPLEAFKLYEQDVKGKTVLEDELARRIVERTTQALNAQRLKTYSDEDAYLYILIMQSVGEALGIDMNTHAQTAKALGESRAAYEKAVKLLLADATLVEGVNLLSQVIDTDENYEDASAKLAEHEASYLNLYGDYLDTLAAAGDYIVLGDTITLMLAVYPQNQTLVQGIEAKKTEIRNKALETADDLATRGDYDTAKAIVNSLYFIWDREGMDAKLAALDEHAINRSANMLTEALGRIQYSYDEWGRDYYINGLGVALEADGTMPEGLAVVPTVMYDDARATSFFLDVGLAGDKAIGLDRITFDCDGERLVWRFSTQESSQTQGEGRVGELYTVLDSRSGATSTDDEDEAPRFLIQRDLEPVVSAISKANTVSVTLGGADGSFTHTLTEGEKQAVVDLWEIYLLLGGSPESIVTIIPGSIWESVQ